MAIQVALALFLVLMSQNGAPQGAPEKPYVVTLGIAQDGGAPQAGTKEAPGWSDPRYAHTVACLAIVDPQSGQRWMLDCTPDFPEQLHELDRIAPAQGRKPGLDGIFLTHAHIGHYTGLMFLGHEVMGARGVPVYAMPKMHAFLSGNGPWDQLVRYGNIELRPLAPDTPVALNERITVEAIPVPHRQEYSEVVGFRISGPERSVLFIPDIDSWEEWDDAGVQIEDQIARVDVAYLDATFYSDQELPGRDMSGFPHPFITHSMDRFASLPAGERTKVRFIHFNHTNPALDPGSDASRAIAGRGFRTARELERVDL
jgi:pyrroloquinoline quinone biosynthesis protein B